MTVIGCSPSRVYKEWGLSERLVFLGMVIVTVVGMVTILGMDSEYPIDVQLSRDGC